MRRRHRRVSPEAELRIPNLPGVTLWRSLPENSSPHPASQKRDRASAPDGAETSVTTLQSSGLGDLLLQRVNEGLHEKGKPQCAGSHTTTSCLPHGSFNGHRGAWIQDGMLALKVVSRMRDINLILDERTRASLKDAARCIRSARRRPSYPLQNPSQGRANWPNLYVNICFTNCHYRGLLSQIAKL